MNPARSITSSEAKASLGELLGSLATEGPVEITRHGRKVAVLSAPPEQTKALEATRLAELAALYATGRVAWREIAAETGASFGDLLVELARQNLQLPRVTPAKRPEQVAMFNAILRQAVKRFSLIVTDSGPLITLGVANALDALLAPRLPVIVPDMVRFEVIRDLSKPGAQEVADWIRAHEGGSLRVASTEVFEEFQVLLAAKPSTRAAGRGEQAAAEVLVKELADQDHGAILLFEDSDVRKQNFLVRLPDEVLVTSTSEFLFGLERLQLLTSAEEILQKATAIRANDILKRSVGGTVSEEVEAWPTRMRRPST